MLKKQKDETPRSSPFYRIIFIIQQKDSKDYKNFGNLIFIIFHINYVMLLT